LSSFAERLCNIIDETTQHAVEADIAFCADRFDHCLQDWIEGVDLKDALFLNLYYRQQARLKLGYKARSFESHAEKMTCRQFSAFVRRHFRHAKARLWRRPQELQPLRGTSRILAIVGGPQEVRFVQTLRRFIESDAYGFDDFQFLLKKPDVSLSTKFGEVFPGGGAVSMGDLVPASMPGSHYRDWCSRWRDLARRVWTLPEAERIRAVKVLGMLPSVLSVLWQVKRMFDQQPSVVLGAFEKSALGTLLYEYASLFRPECQIVGIQHGHIWQSPALSKVKLDKFLVWDELAAKNLAASGYPLMDGVEIVGNPLWSDLRQAVADLQAAPSDFTEWKQGAPVILVFLQPLKADLQKRFRELVLGYLEVRSDVRLLLRPHPIYPNSGEKEWFANLDPQKASRIRIAPDEEMSFASALAFADVVCAIHSAALQDAVYAGCPAVSVWLDDAAATMGGECFSEVVQLCRSESDLHRSLDAGLSGESPTIKETTLPFEERLAYLLVDLEQAVVNRSV
jgi:phage-related protein